MARPKKSPRMRFQISLSRKLGRRLRAFAKSRDAEISAVVSEAVSAHLRETGEPPVETAGMFPFPRD